MSQLNHIFTTLDQTNPKCTKRGIIHSLFNFLFGNLNSSTDIEFLKNNMTILEENQNVLSSQIQKTFNFVNLAYAETNTNRLLLSSLQKHILQENSSPTPIERAKSTFYDRNFFITMFQLRCHLAALQSGINLVRIDILSILDQLSVISSQKLKLTNPSGFKLLLSRLGDQHLTTFNSPSMGRGSPMVHV